MNAQAAKKIQDAKIALILGQPFFGSLALRLETREDNTQPTMYTDGKTLGYNADFVNKLNTHELQGVICHEVLHCANGHPWRKDARDHRKFNEACDYAINPIVVEAGMALPQGDYAPLIDPKFTGLSAEEIYAQLPDSPEGDNGNGCGMGEVRDGQNPDTAAQEQADWQIATEQAAQSAKMQGKLPASLDRFVKELLRPKIDWRSVLRRFIQQASKSDYSWKQPNRRYMPIGLYLPSLYNEEMGTVAIGVDTSGSVNDEQLQRFASEINAIAVDCLPERTEVIYCDAAVQRHDTFTRGEPLTFDSPGGGGTDFTPVFDHIDTQALEPICVIYLTDGQGSFPDVAPSYPVLWILTQDYTVPFGESVRLEVN